MKNLSNKSQNLSSINNTVIFKDIAKSRDAEIELKKSEEKLKSVFKGFPIPSYIWQRIPNDFILIDHNNAAEIFTQGLIKKFVGSRFSKIYQKSPYKKAIEYNLLKCLSEKITLNHEMQYRLRSTDEMKDLKVSYVYVPANLVLVHTQDITTNKIVEEDLKLLSNAVEQTADSVVITDKNGIIEYVNPAFEEITGYSRKEVFGKTPRILKSDKQDESFYKKLWETILTENSYQGTIINKKKNGEFFTSRQTITAMKNKNGIITHFVSVLRDITEQIKQHEQESRLQIACDLQQRLLKSKINVPGIDMAGKTFSAIETCGDYFDFLLMKDGSVLIVISDVCGHGIGAALIMVQTRAYLRLLAQSENDIGVILSKINQALVEDLDDIHYVTMVLARLEPENNLIEYVSAGHIPAYLIKGPEEKHKILESTGIPLGILKDYNYLKGNPIKLAKGNILAFITDGIVEARVDDDVEEFGYERTLDVIKSNRSTSAENIIEQIYITVRSFVKNQPQADDITSIICKFNK